MTTVHIYKGIQINECERVKGEHSGRWVIRDIHKSGLLYSDEECPHYPSLKAAKEAIADSTNAPT